MLGTAITELFTNQWVGLLLSKATDNAILILTITTGIMVLGRGLAEPIVHRFSPQGVLLASAVFSALGLYLMSTTTGGMLFVAALIFGIGVCYFWPCMLGFVSEYVPKSGAVGINLLGGAGMFAVSIYTFFMGGVYDRIILSNLPQGADLKAYQGATAGSTEAAAYANAQLIAGPEVIKTTLIIPIFLVVAFVGLVVYMRNKKKPSLVTSASH
jgi:MFS family permease